MPTRLVARYLALPLAALVVGARPDMRWRPVAKDGAELPPSDRVPRRAAQVVSIGETHDVEFVPAERGLLRLEVRPASLGQLTVRVPIEVE